MNKQAEIVISVVTVTWNCASTINDCLDSMSNQTWLAREHIVIDGASSDGTVDLLQKRRNQLSVLVSEPDRGIYDALNKGIALSTGDVIGFLHADDLYAHQDVLADVAKAFSDPTVCAVYGDLQYVAQDDPSKVVRYWRSGAYSPRRLAWGWMPPHPTLYVRREWYEKIGGFDANYRIAADYFSILQLFTQENFKAEYLPQVMVQMRLGGASNRTLRNIWQKSREDLDALRRNKVGGAGALIWKNVSKIQQFVNRHK